MRLAYIYKAPKTAGGYNLYVLAPGEHHLGRAGEEKYAVAGKREARRICANLGAKPHNF